MKGFYEFGPFRIEPVKRLLLRDQQLVSVSNRAFDLLLALIEARDRVLSKDELLKKVWPDTIVEENNLTVAMSGLRKALGEGGNERRYILTIPGHGYRFLGDVRALPDDNQAGTSIQDSARPTQPTGEAEQAPQRTAQVRAYPKARLLGIAGIAAAVVIGALVYPFLSHRGNRRQSIQSIHSIAVLPFKMIGTGENDEYLGVGLADALTSKLSNLSQLKVTPTGSVLRYNQNTTTPVAAGRELSVDAVLDGEMQRSGNQIRVTVQLVGVGDGSTLWADSFMEDFTNVFALEDSISAGASEHLALKLTETEKKVLARHVTQNPEAYQAYMKGRYFWDKDTEQPMLKSIQYFQQAIADDPNFALAYVGVADAYSELVIQGYFSATGGFPKVKAAALTALQLDPALAEPHNSLGIVAWGLDWDWATAEKEFNRAAELNPDNAATHSNRAFFFMTMKRFDQSIAEAKRAAELSPASASTNTTVGYAYFAAQRYGDSSIWLNKALDLDPDFSFPGALLAVNYALDGKATEALAAYAKIREIANSGKDPLVSAMAAYACAISGDRKDALAILERLKHSPPQRYVDPYAIAIVYSGLGDNRATLDWLERTFREHSLSAVFFNFDPFFLKFHADPRLANLMREARLPN
jgi:DNA-binding winged helix-turn-helix (wHTH) protein/TolB-like protein/Flp pilus assembly protein TadD